MSKNILRLINILVLRDLIKNLCGLNLIIDLYQYVNELACSIYK